MICRHLPATELKPQEKDATLPRLAASYAFGIARNHAFVDGNKRTALVVCLGFLRFNGMTITATREDRYLTFLSLAAGEMTEAQMTEWLERYIVPLQPAPVLKSSCSVRVPLSLSSFSNRLAGGLEVQSYTEVSTQLDMDQLLNSIAGFHDSMTKEVHLINRGAVLPNHSMDMLHGFDAQVLIQSQWPPFALELLFTKIKALELKSAREYWGASGLVEERHEPVQERTITMHFDSNFKIASESLHIRTRGDWLGHQPFFGTEVPRPDAVPARVLQDQWRQCSICADAWEADSHDDFSRCPNCGAITELVR